MSTEFEKAAEQAQAFQQIWLESMSKVMQSAFTVGQSGPPPELLKEIRAGIFKALAQSWEEFMRSPQFTESMKQWMDNAIGFRRMTNDFMAKVRNEMQAASKDDIDQIMLSIRHMEKRLLDRIDLLCSDIKQTNSAFAGRQGNGSRKRPPRASKRLQRKRAPG
jgi:hypothetical protein